MSTSFAAETAAIVGQTKRDINRQLSRADGLGSYLDAVVGTSSDNKGVELDALKALLLGKRAPLIERARDGEKISREVWEALYPETGGSGGATCLKDGRMAGPQHAQKFAAETAAIVGQTKRDINRQLSRTYIADLRKAHEGPPAPDKIGAAGFVT